MELFDSKENVELWAGVECTLNRVGDYYFDQLRKNGHRGRVEDLDSFAELGVRTIRYPILWEHIAPESLGNADWSWADERLNRLRELQIRPIVGLLHHGSGPVYTNLTDPDFPEKFAGFALNVAERYPWINDYTPVNEPLTTARFSGLYGFWYPHKKSDAAFARALLGQCRATILAMRQIRRVNPQAKLIQTEDLGKVYSTPKLGYQAEFENERRWLTFDLLGGRVNREHPMWEFLLYAGIKQRELEWFLDNPCSPDIAGFNYYLTSERFLDDKIEQYPPHCSIGGNGRDRYVDVEAVRVNLQCPTGLPVLIREAWERYNLPLALTEVHLGCTREEQLRWFSEIWETANNLKRQGIDLRAVTAWSLLGSFDWNSLLTVEQNHYEPGVFDVRGQKPRPTALARLIKNIAAGQKYDCPATEGLGWWRRSSRFIIHPTATERASFSKKANGKNINSNRAKAKNIIITGATGTLGRAFASFCEIRGLSYRLLTRCEMDIADKDSINLALAKYEPWAVINTAGYVRVDMAESEAESCFRENTKGAVNLAEVCRRKKISYLTFSSDLVFDGQKKRPYIESDLQNPLNTYGRSKAAAEKQILGINPAALIVRTAAFFSPWDEFNFLTAALRSLNRGKTFKAANDNFISPTYLPDLVNACLDILIDGESGLWHLTNRGELTWADFAYSAAKIAGLDSTLVKGCATADLNLSARRPAYSVLGSERGILLPNLDDSLNRFVKSFRTRL